MKLSFRTTPPVDYLAPTREEMREVAKGVELKSFAPDFVADLANIAAGGAICPPSAYREEVAAQASERLPKPDDKGNWRLSNGEFTKNRQEAVSDQAARLMKYHSSVSDFLRTVDFSQAPGRSPLEKAMNLLKILSKQKPDQGEGGEGDPLPIFQDESGEQLAREMNDLLETVESLDQAEKELLEEDPETAEKGNKDLQKRKLAEDMTGDKSIWLKISRQLDGLARMRVARTVKVVPDPEGEEVRNRPIRHLGELTRVAKSAWAVRQQKPVYFWYQAVSGQLPIRERVKREEKKQLLYLLIDCSGSMDNDQRIAKAGGVLFNRLKAVCEGEAEIFVRFFDSQVYEEFFASNAKEAKGLMNRFREQNFSGGSTNISGCARTAQARIEEIVAEGKMTRPELVIITDGDDRIDLKAEDLKGTKMHAFVVGGSNARLTELAVETGGVGINDL